MSLDILRQEGLFRLSGSLTVISELKNTIDKGGRRFCVNDYAESN